MKLKNNEPGKIWAKSDHWFQSYDHITVVKGPWVLGAITRNPTRYPGNCILLPG